MDRRGTAERPGQVGPMIIVFKRPHAKTKTPPCSRRQGRTVRRPTNDKQDPRDGDGISRDRVVAFGLVR